METIDETPSTTPSLLGSRNLLTPQSQHTVEVTASEQAQAAFAAAAEPARWHAGNKLAFLLAMSRTGKPVGFGGRSAGANARKRNAKRGAGDKRKARG